MGNSNQADSIQTQKAQQILPFEPNNKIQQQKKETFIEQITQQNKRNQSISKIRQSSLRPLHENYKSKELKQKTTKQLPLVKQPFKRLNESVISQNSEKMKKLSGQFQTLAETNKQLQISKTLILKRTNQKADLIIQDIDFNQENIHQRNQGQTKKFRPSQLKAL